MEENLSNLTSASGEASACSGNHSDQIPTNYSGQYFSTPPPPKKKRNLPGNPDPDAEVIALSPKTLMATNRFVCEICGKGFQRDQNLQLHRRGHNLPWKLKQRANKEVISPTPSPFLLPFPWQPSPPATAISSNHKAAAPPCCSETEASAPDPSPSSAAILQILQILQKKKRRRKPKKENRCFLGFSRDLRRWELNWRRNWVLKERGIGRMWHWWAFHLLFMYIYLRRLFVLIFFGCQCRNNCGRRWCISKGSFLLMIEICVWLKFTLPWNRNVIWLLTCEYI